MTEIYLIRHGYTTSNELDMFVGQKNVDLTEIGRAQAKRTSEYLNKFDITKIYVSDLVRTSQTAEPLSKSKNLTVIKRKGLREIAAGEWDFVTYSDINLKYPDAWKLWSVDICSSYCVGGETFIEVQDRVYAEMEKIALESEGEQIAVYSHGTSIKAFICKVLGITGATANDLPYPGNASVTKLIYDSGKFSIEFYSKNDFLGDIATGLVLKK